MRCPVGLLLLAGLLLCCERQPAGTPSSSGPSTPAPSTASPSATTGSTARATRTPDGPRSAAGVEFVQVLTAGAKEEDRLPLVIAIHGLGDRPEKFAWLLRDLPVPARVIVPRGLDPWHGGYSWFPIRVWDPDPQRIAAGIRRATDALVAAIGVLRKRHAHRGGVFVTGFSQGGMLSFALAVQHPQLVEAAFPLAGWLPRPLWPSQSPADGAPPIVAFHGMDDDLLPIAPTRELVESMRHSGYDVTFRELDDTAHTVSPEIRSELSERLSAALRDHLSPPRPSASAPPIGRPRAGAEARP